MRKRIKIILYVLGISFIFLISGVLLEYISRQKPQPTELEKLNAEKAEIEIELKETKESIVTLYKHYLDLKNRRKQIQIRIEQLINQGSIPVDLEWMPQYFKEHPELMRDAGDIITGDNGKPEKKFPDNIKTVKNFLDRYGLGYTYDYWYEMGKKYNIVPELGICIAWADSNLGRALASSNNLGNVGNNDRGNRIHYPHIRAGIEGIYKVLNGKYLSNIQTIGGLSCGGRQKLYEMGIIDKNQLCGNKGVYVYASSKYNWNNNVIICLRKLLHNKDINETFRFRSNNNKD